MSRDQGITCCSRMFSLLLWLRIWYGIWYLYLKCNASVEYIKGESDGLMPQNSTSSTPSWLLYPLQTHWGPCCGIGPGCISHKCPLLIYHCLIPRAHCTYPCLHHLECCRGCSHHIIGVECFIPFCSRALTLGRVLTLFLHLVHSFILAWDIAWPPPGKGKVNSLRQAE